MIHSVLTTHILPVLNSVLFSVSRNDKIISELLFGKGILPAPPRISYIRKGSEKLSGQLMIPRFLPVVIS